MTFWVVDLLLMMRLWDCIHGTCDEQEPELTVGDYDNSENIEYVPGAHAPTYRFGGSLF